MTVYKPTMRHLREVLLYYFNSKESAAVARRMLVHAYGKNIISKSTCERNFQQFRSGDFNLNRRTFESQNKERIIQELVRLRLEDPRMTQKMIAAKFGVSRQTVYKYERSQEYQNKIKEKEPGQSSIPLEILTPSVLKRKRAVEELVRLKLEDPSMTQAEMATKVGTSQMTVCRYQKSQEYQNKIKTLQQDQSSIRPGLYKRYKSAYLTLERTTLKRKHRELEEEESLNILDEIPPITNDEKAKEHELSIFKAEGLRKSVENRLGSGSQPKKRRISRSPSKELEEEESLNILDVIPPITNNEIAKEHELSISKAEGLKKSVENRLESGSQPKKRPTSRTLCREWEDEELVRLLSENPGIPHSEIAKQLGISKRIVLKRVRTQEIQSLLKDKRQRPTTRRSRKEWEDGELVRLLYENPDIPHRELAIQLGISQTTLPTRINSPEIQNKLKERMQEESSIPKTLEHQSV